MQEKAAICCRKGTLVFIYLLFHPSTVLWSKLKLLTLVHSNSWIMPQRIISVDEVLLKDAGRKYFSSWWNSVVTSGAYLKPRPGSVNKLLCMLGRTSVCDVRRVFRSLLSLSLTPQDRGRDPEDRSVHAPSPCICTRTLPAAVEWEAKLKVGKKAHTNTHTITCICLLPVLAALLAIKARTETRDCCK